MIVIGRRKISIVVMCSIAMHLFWAAMIVVDRTVLNTNSVSALYRYVHEPNLLFALLVATSLLAILGICSRAPLVALLLIPQQLVLMASAGGAIEAAWLGQFADGVVRSHAFIAADQVYSIVIAIGHTAAIVSHAMKVPA